MKCLEKEIEFSIPQMQLVSKRVEHTIRIGGEEQTISYNAPSLETRNCHYKISFKICYPDVIETANQVIGEAIASGAKIAAVSVMTAPEPTAKIALEAFNEGFQAYLQKQDDEIRAQFTNVTTEADLKKDCEPWESNS